jgi:alpha-N-acetylglucosaminidase
LHSYAADLTQTPTFIRLGSPDTGTLMKAFAGNGPGPCVATGTFDTRPAADALQRLLGAPAGQITLRPAASQAAGDYFAVCAKGGSPVVAATSNATLVSGANWYLKNVVHAGVTWDGDSVARLPSHLPAPDTPQFESTPFVHRFADNDVMSAYTGPDWTWDQWQREIDVMAANGINEMLVYPGQALVYYDVFKQFGYADAELRNWIPQPGHQPWWLLQNMSSYNEPISMAVLQQQADLARRIVERLRSLGMTPVLPGYYGTVPPDFAAKNPGAHIVPQGDWGGFTRPDWLDPRDSHFAPIASAFYADQTRLFGASSMYKMDLLHEGGQAGDVPVDAAAHAVQTALDTAHPGATWVILGWQSNPQPELLAGVDKSKMLIVDGLSDRYTGLNREQSWSGTPYAYGSIWNFGGHTTIGANLTTWASELPAWASKPGSALSGIAIMPEANDNNPAAFSFLSDLAWHPDGVDPKTWMNDYASWRYGGSDPHAQAAWQALLDTAYSMPNDGWSEAQDGLFEAQPSLTVTNAASWSPGSMRYDAAQFAQALPDLLAVAPDLRHTSAYSYDLVDVARQVLANESRVLLPQIQDTYDAKDQARFSQLTQHWLDLMSLQDKLLGTDSHFLLGPWLASARAAGATAAEKDQLEYDARALITEWGPRASAEANGLHDYANREWAGLVGDFYRDRWQRYFTNLDTSLKTGQAPAAIDWYAVDDAWASANNSYPTQPTGDPYTVASQVWQTVSRDPIFGQLSANAAPKAVAAGGHSTVTATFTNANPANAAQEVSLGISAPNGFTVTPTSPTTFDSVPVGGNVKATFTVTVPTEYQPKTAIDQIDLNATATFAYSGGTRGSTTSSAALLVAKPVVAPNRTAAFTDAVLGQAGDSYAIYAAGNDLWGGTNQFATVYRPGALGASGAVTTRVVAQDRTGPWARAGIVVRNDLSANGSAGFLNLAVTPDNGCALSWDADGNGQLEHVATAVGFTAPTYLKLTRDGTTFSAACSIDGTNWTTVGTATMPSAAGTEDVGLFDTAANGGSGAAGLARFDAFTIG